MIRSNDILIINSITSTITITIYKLLKITSKIFQYLSPKMKKTYNQSFKMTWAGLWLHLKQLVLPLRQAAITEILFTFCVVGWHGEHSDHFGLLRWLLHARKERILVMPHLMIIKVIILPTATFHTSSFFFYLYHAITTLIILQSQILIHRIFKCRSTLHNHSASQSKNWTLCNCFHRLFYLT